MHTKILELPKEGYARPAQVAFALGVSRATLYNRIKAGAFPAPEKDGERISKWPVDVVREYLPKVSHRAGGQDNQPTPAS